MLTLVTGATGLVGFNIVKLLLAKGRSVRVLVRDEAKGRTVLPPECDFCVGDITDKSSLHRAMSDCQVVYHAAGLPEQWLPTDQTFIDVNVEGTRNIVAVALDQRIEKFIYTSTIDVFEGATGASFDESIIDPNPKGTAYERSKQVADGIVVAAIEQGLPAVFLHPSGVYGPGPSISSSPGLNDFFVNMKKGEIPMLLPGGFPVVYSEDVAAGHLAAESAAVGSRYILSESLLTLTEVAAIVSAQLGHKKLPPVMPFWVAKIVSMSGEALAKFSGKAPLIPKGQLVFMQWYSEPLNHKARQELGWQPKSFEQGVELSLQFLFPDQ